MKKIVIILADGVEETEFIAVGDVLRRLSFVVTVAGLSGLDVTGAHGFGLKAERLLAEEICDGVSLSRPLIRDPEIVRRWLAGETARSTCVSCNGCFRPILTGRGLFCPRDQRGARNHES